MEGKIVGNPVFLRLVLELVPKVASRAGLGYYRTVLLGAPKGLVYMHSPTLTPQFFIPSLAKVIVPKPPDTARLAGGDDVRQRGQGSAKSKRNGRNRTHRGQK